jgi:hypothetical protein
MFGWQQVVQRNTHHVVEKVLHRSLIKVCSIFTDTALVAFLFIETSWTPREGCPRAVHIKYYKYVLQKLTVGAIEIWTYSGLEKEKGEMCKGKQMVAPWFLQEEDVHFHWV